MVDKRNSFEFFSSEIIKEVREQIDPSLPTSIKNFEIENVVAIGQKAFISVKDGNVYIFEGNHFTKCFQPFKSKLTLISRSSYESKGLLICIGIENDNNVKTSYVKFYDMDTLMGDSKNIHQRNSKNIVIGKIGSPIESIVGFECTPDLTHLAIGLADQIIVFKSKNFLHAEYKEINFPMEKCTGYQVHFAPSDPTQFAYHLYAVSKPNIFCFTNLQNKKLLQSPGSSISACNEKGDLFCVIGEKSTLTILHHTNKPKNLPHEGEKKRIYCYGKEYIVLEAKRKTEKSTSVSSYFTVYDYVNEFTASERALEILHVSCGQNMIYLVVVGVNKEKQLHQLSEKDNSQKLEGFIKKECFDLAVRFSTYKGYNPALLAEVSKQHADHLYNNRDYAKAIENYILTVKHVEPSYVIRKFLDVSHIDLLIKYLEYIHKEKRHEKHHTALLLNCYVKQKAITKLEEFFNESSLDDKIFDTETAVKVCRDAGKTDLSLNLALKCNHHDLVLRLYIEDKKDYNKAVEYIRTKLELLEKIKFIKEFGQTLIKNAPSGEKEPDILLMIEYLAHLASIKEMYNEKKKTQSEITVNEYEKQTISTFLCFNPENWQKIFEMTFPKPDDFFHLFVTSNELFERYLNYLKTLKKLPNEKVVFHRYIEFYLEKYSKYYSENKSTLSYRETKDLTLENYTKKIMEILKNQEYANKYDKNQVLVLFKMYSFTDGVVFLCEEMKLQEELLHFFIENNNYESVLKHCETNGAQESNLWIQALKYAAKPENKIENKIPELLEKIAKVDTLSPLLVLNILSNKGNIKFSSIKAYYISKISAIRKETKEDEEMVEENNKNIQKDKDKYRMLKTQAKVFQNPRCTSCNQELGAYSIHFMCGHSFHKSCLEGDEMRCREDYPDHETLDERMKAIEKTDVDKKKFNSDLEHAPSKFDIVAEYFGKGIFKSQSKKFLCFSLMIPCKSNQKKNSFKY